MLVYIVFVVMEWYHLSLLPSFYLFLITVIQQAYLIYSKFSLDHPYSNVRLSLFIACKTQPHPILISAVEGARGADGFP